MIGQLTKDERQLAIFILGALAAIGLAMAGLRRGDPPRAPPGPGVFCVIWGYFEPEPGEDRLDRYYDEPSKIGILLAMAWAVFGLFVGDWVAWLLVDPNLTFDAGWSSFGRIRPVHTTSVIFGFGGNAL